jgi:5'(3')-deoxyribonucleotidase
MYAHVQIFTSTYAGDSYSLSFCALSAEKMQLVFPEHGSPDFARRLHALKEYQLFAVPPSIPVKDASAFEERVHNACSSFEKTMYQHLVQHYLSKRSPYRSILLYHGLGVGKTCSSITVAEAFLMDHRLEDEPRILVVSPSALKKSYEEQIFSISKMMDRHAMKDQCTSDTYAHLVHGAKDAEAFAKRVQQVIRARYQFLTYDGLIEYTNKNPSVRNKIIIIDEAHNLRQQEAEKRTAEALENMIANGQGNRLVLLSATPMYNEPDEIFWLLSLLLKNDRQDTRMLPKSLFRNDEWMPRAKDVLTQLASEYISYIRGKNPYTFAARIRPSASGYAVHPAEWSQVLKDGILPSTVGSKQKVSALSKQGDASISAAPKQLQWLNITYPGDSHGEKGFWKMFQKKSGDVAFPASYRKTHEGALRPIPGHLDTLASKLATICNCVRKSEGIVLVYSQFVWSGVVPLAIALEHMGFERAGGQNLLARSVGTQDERVTFPGVPFPRYCILSGDAQVMGGTKMETLRQMINDETNMHGEKVKVVLITPIAGEGLSFRNMREVHILDPWYHINRTEQVIGRAIRTCSHTQLPLEERNVTVFLHACLSDNMVTADEHAYRIACRKLRQTTLVEEVLRNHAMDCSLLHHLNHQPTSLFPFQVVMRTSQGSYVPYQFGDEEATRPTCASQLPPSTDITMRKEVYQSMFPTILRRLEKYVQKRLPTSLYFAQQELIGASGTDRDLCLQALETVLYPRSWVAGYRMYVHREGFVFIPEQQVSKQFLLPLPQARNVEDAAPSTCQLQTLLASIPTKTDPAMIAYTIYTSVDDQCWRRYMEAMLTDPEVYAWVLSVLALHGVLVLAKELPSHKHKFGKYIGFVDIFAPSFHVLLASEEGFREASEKEVSMLSSKRTTLAKPSEDLPYGMFVPEKSKAKQTTTVTRCVFKLMTPGPVATKKRGVVCLSNTKGELEEAMRALGLSPKGDKFNMCYDLGLHLFKMGRVVLPPELKVV